MRRPKAAEAWDATNVGTAVENDVGATIGAVRPRAVNVAWLVFATCLSACSDAPSKPTPAAVAVPTTTPDVPPAADPVPKSDPVPITAEGEPIVLARRTARDVELSLEATKRQWLLGENIVVHYVVKNVGSKPTSVSFGGDYRGGVRATRVKVKITDASGRALDDPHPSDGNFGGRGGDYQLKPGDEFAFTVQLGRYRRFKTAGVHRISVAHDLGWTSEDEPLAPDDERWVEGELEIGVPSVGQAKTVVANMTAMSSDANKSVAKRAVAFADFSALAYPVYLPLLVRSIETEPRAMNGLAHIETVEATRALIKLGGHDDHELATRALEAVAARLPWTGDGARWNKVEHDALVAKSWDEAALGSDLRGLAETLLAESEPQRVMNGARLLSAVATTADADTVTRALDRTLEATKTTPIAYPEPRTAVSELLAVARVLVAKGVVAKAAPKSPGEIAMYVVQHGRAATRPPDYAELATRWLDHEVAQLGVLVLRRTSLPLDATIVAELPRLVGKDHLGLANAACTALGQSGIDSTAHAPVLAAMKTVADRWLTRCLHATAVAIGVPLDEIADVWVERLGDPDRVLTMLDQLQFLFDNNGSGSGAEPNAAEAARLSKRWKAFVGKHRKRIRAGKLFELNDPALTPDLLPPEYSLSSRDGTRWPAE